MVTRRHGARRSYGKVFITRSVWMGRPVPARDAYIIVPIWDQFATLLPDREMNRPLGCHRPHVPDRVVFDKHVQVLVFGCACRRMADTTCSATTLRRRRDEWIDARVLLQLQALVLGADDQMIGLTLTDLAVDGCITTAPCGGEGAGRCPVDRGKLGITRSTVVDALGTPLGTVAAPAKRNDALLLDPTLATFDGLGPLRDVTTIHVVRGDDSGVTRERLDGGGLCGEIAERGKPVPVATGKRWPGERTNAWTNAHKTLVKWTDRRVRHRHAALCLATTILIIGKLLTHRDRWSPTSAPIR